MRIILNGEETETPARTVAALLRELGAPPVGTAIAVNGCVVRRSEHETHELQENDDIEFIRAVQGG